MVPNRLEIDSTNSDPHNHSELPFKDTIQSYHSELLFKATTPIVRLAVRKETTMLCWLFPLLLPDELILMRSLKTVRDR